VRAPGAQPVIEVHRRIGVGRQQPEIGRFVVALRDALDERADRQRNDVDPDPDRPKAVAHEDRAALERRVAGLRQERQARRPNAWLIQHPVAVGVGGIEGREQAARLGQVALAGRRRDVPRSVARRHQPARGHGRPEIDRVGEGPSIDRFCDRLAERAMLPPPGVRAARSRRQIEPEQIAVETDTHLVDQKPALVGLAGHGPVVGRPQLGRRQVELPAREQQLLSVLVGHDALGGLALGLGRSRQMVRVPSKRDPLAWRDRVDHERTQTGQLRRRRRRPPGRGEPTLIERRLEPVPRQDRHGVEQAQSRREGGRERHDDRVRVLGVDLERLMAHRDHVAEHRTRALVVQGTEGEGHVV
jgi:hypothetical protein